MIGAVIALAAHRAIGESRADGTAADRMGRIIAMADIDSYWPRERRASPQIVFMAAMCRWLIGGDMSPETFADHLKRLWPRAGEPWPGIAGLASLAYISVNPAAVYATSASEAAALISDVFTAIDPGGAMARKRALAVAEAVAVYLRQYSAVEVDGRRQTLSLADIIRHADATLPPDMRGKFLVFRGIEKPTLIETLRPITGLGYLETIWTTPQGSIDIGSLYAAPRSGSLLFPIHDASMWPYCQMYFFDRLAEASLPEDIATLFLDFDRAVYARHNLDLSAGSLGPAA